MSNFMETLPQKTRINMARAVKVALATAVFVLAGMRAVYADGVTIGNADALIKNIVSLIAAMGRYLGIVLAAWGAIQLALSFKNEDADSKTRALMLIICAVILFNVQGFIDLLQMG